MKGFLLDENLPSRVQFSPSLPIISFSVVGRNPTDTDMWNYARQHELVIVSKDADFSSWIMSQSPPPWVVHLKFGNLRRGDFHALLSRVWPQVESLLKTKKLVNVYLDRVEGIK